MQYTTPCQVILDMPLHCITLSKRWLARFGFSLLLVASVSASIPASPASAVTGGTYQVATHGCAMAHCDPRMSNIARMMPPSSIAPASVWHDTSRPGSTGGLGCSSNGSMVVCTFTTNAAQPTPTLTAYDAEGNQLWSSSLLDANAYASAPLITSNGDVIAADDHTLVRFDSAGNVLWQTTTPGGIPISPTITDSGIIILATALGPISAYNSTTGALVSTLNLSATLPIGGRNVDGYFDTVNTPTLIGNRVYISMQFRDSANDDVLSVGRLYAIDVVTDNTGQATLVPAWYYEFGGPSKASPLLYEDSGKTDIYFDGSALQPGDSFAPHLFAIQDRGTAPQLLWTRPTPNDVPISPAQDPRGGLWVFAHGSPNLVRLAYNSGVVLQKISLSTLVGNGGAACPASVMTITGTASQPVMIVSAMSPASGASYVVAIDLADSSLLWTYEVDQGLGRSAVPNGQFPIVQTAGGTPEVVFSTYGNGVWGIGG